MSDALATLTAAFDDPFTPHGTDATRHRPIAVTSWPAVPLEIIRGAGLRPVVIRGTSARTPAADTTLERDIFPNRLRQLMELALTGQLHHARCIVLPRTSDPDYKAFLYLRELCRLGTLSSRGAIMLFDLLQSDGPDVHAYNTTRTRELFKALAGLTDPVASANDLWDVIARTNVARAALRRLSALRCGIPRVSGAEVLPLIGAFWQLDPEDYAALANDAADLLSRRAVLEGPRVLLAGAPVDGPALHRAIESHGAVVVAEPGPWGCEAAGDDVTPGYDPFASIAKRYRHVAIGARTPHHILRLRMERLLDGIDAVVVSLPPDDAVFGWQYPAWRALMDARQLPYVCVCSDPGVPLAPAEEQGIAALVAQVQAGAGARHG